MDLAARLLRETPRVIESIGEACGYTARAALGQAFERVHGTSPRRSAARPASATEPT